MAHHLPILWYLYHQIHLFFQRCFPGCPSSCLATSTCRQCYRHLHQEQGRNITRQFSIVNSRVHSESLQIPQRRSHSKSQTAWRG
ncbi:hypothetical protein FKM82_023913 [Ascaphus truei]